MLNLGSLKKNLQERMFVSKLENLKHRYAMIILYIIIKLHDLLLIYFLLINFILILLLQNKMLFDNRLNTFKLILISFKNFLRVTIFLMLNFMKFITIKAIYFLKDAQKLLMQKKKYFWNIYRNNKYLYVY